MPYIEFIINGLLATLVMTLVMYAAMTAGLPLDLTRILGLVFVGPERKTLLYTIGFVLQFVNGAVFGIVYGLLYVFLGISSGIIWWGIAFGFLHGLLAGTGLGIVSGIHPRLGSGEQGILAPGFFGGRLSRWNPPVLIILHMIYGGVFGSLLR